MAEKKDKHSDKGDSYNELQKCIETLTKTGEKSLDPDVLKSVTRICKSSNNFVIHSYHLLMEQLNAKHSEIRFSAFQICIELFKRSHCFRELLVSNLQRVMELTAETNPSSCPLPPPRRAANMLKRLSLVTIKEWAKKFGDGYKKLHLGISFLKNCKKVDFQAILQEESAQASHRQELGRRKLAMEAERLKKVESEMKDVVPDIIGCINEMHNCLTLLLPKPENLFEGSTDLCTDGSSENKKNEIDTSNIDFRSYGILNPQFSITLHLNTVQSSAISKTDENSAIIENAQDLFKVIWNRYVPCVEKWEIIIKKCDGLEAEKVEPLLNRVLNLKNQLECITKNYNHLQLGAIPSRNTNDSDTSDSEFEEVVSKEGYEAFSKSTPVFSKEEPGPSTSKGASSSSSQRNWSLISDENHEKDPTSLFSTLPSLSKSNLPKPSTSRCCEESSFKSAPPQSDDLVHGDRKTKLLAIAPKRPFDVDLYHWEDDKLEAPTRFTVKPDGHRFWVSTAEENDEVRDPDGEASLRTRVIEFAGEFKSVEWMCRAPLPNGKLCPRQDRFKCPFHGKIIGRDKDGKPTDPLDLQREKELEEEKRQKQVPDWQDPKLLKELKESTGVDLRMPDKSKRGWRKRIPGEEEKKYRGLTDLEEARNTVYNRLSKKVFQKASMKRVAADIDKLERKRFRDKYGDQFNYAME